MPKEKTTSSVDVASVVAATVRALVTEGEVQPTSKAVRVVAPVAAKVPADEGDWVLVDSGATHEVRPLSAGADVPVGARPCDLQLAVGEVGAWMDADDVVWVDEAKGVQELFPLGRYISECSLTLTWDKKGGTLTDSDNRTYQVSLRGDSPYLKREDVEALREMRATILKSRRREKALAAVGKIKKNIGLIRHRV